MPRRAWRRHNIRRNKAAASNPSTSRLKEKLGSQTYRTQGRGPQRRSFEAWPDDTDSSFNCGSDGESDGEPDGEYGERIPVALQAVPTARTRERQQLADISSDDLDSESDLSDFDVDSGYGSLEEDSDEFYDGLLERFRTEGPTLANHSENTKNMMHEQEQKWRKFCSHRKLDPVEALSQCDVPLFKVYWVWRVKNSRIKKESAVMAYWKILSMVYAQKTASWMSDEVLYDVRNWIHVYLTPTYGLDTSKKEKAGIFVEDLAVLLNHHWIRDEEVFAHERLRVQLAANLILAGATATRPGALIGQLLYEHIEFQLFRGLTREERPHFVLKPKEFAFREDDMLIYDPLIPIMALAFADDAFVNKFKGPEDIYGLVVGANEDRIRLHWKEEWLKRTVFRDVESSANGVRVALDKALQYSKERGHLIRLGRSIGLSKALEWYDLRRGSGKKLNEALTPEERNKIMGHRQGDSTVYVMYYMSNFNDADCQSICFGSAPQHDLIHLAGRLLRHGDAPTVLTDHQKFEVSQNPTLVRCRQKRARALQQIKSRGYPTRKDAEGTELAARYDHYNKKADRLNKKLKSKRLQQAIKDFHNSIHVDEVNRELNGIKPSMVIAPPTIEYELPERAQVARLFSQAADVTSREALYPLRMSLVRTLAQLSWQDIFVPNISEGKTRRLSVLTTAAWKFLGTQDTLQTTRNASTAFIYRHRSFKGNS
ncbi:hypothetical protein QBC46DRAFT_424370 [Diplogelasinospora grovesii]|uniref:Uncharacterized protein n=1 Tax=Diplogelasinospora grovesii TaxID=303347 RepID=A0AAN6MWW9_9PEZI|nr:hypothetical protein QBC46DRAFT_424370 [Diplogelasinospora grovesii]